MKTVADAGLLRHELAKFLFKKKGRWTQGCEKRAVKIVKLLHPHVDQFSTDSAPLEAIRGCAITDYLWMKFEAERE